MFSKKLKSTQIFTVISLFLLSGLLSACDKYLDTEPTTSVPESLAFSTVENAEKVINGSWRRYMDTYYTFANPGYGAILRTSDAMGSDVAVARGRYGFLSPYDYLEMHTITGTRVNAFWSILYGGINSANNILDRIDEIPGDDALRKRIKGQALGFRAHAYLTLASFYQLGYEHHADSLTVPIYTTATKSNSKGNPLSPLKDIFNLVISDLTQAETLLADYARPSSTKWKINKNVVQGLLARAYLQTQQWDKAAASAAAARAGYAFMNPEQYLAGFNDLANSEWIWGHGQQPDQSTASYNFHYLDVSSTTSYYYSFMADPYFKNFFDKNDIRYQLFSWDNSAPARYGLLRYEKFKFRSDMTGDIVLMRSAEMSLIQAESQARLGKIDEAVNELNSLRAARNAKPLDKSGLTAASLTDSILVERRKELWGEGFALSDIIRTEGTVKRKAYVKDLGNGNSEPIKIEITLPNGSKVTTNAIGHTTLKTLNNAGEDFKPNSKYYKFSVPETERQNNDNIN